MPQTVDVNSFALGAGEVYFRDIPADPWESLGVTQGNNVFRVRQTKHIPVLNGVKGNVKGLVSIIKETGELELTLPELSPEKISLMIPGAMAAEDGSITGFDGRVVPDENYKFYRLEVPTIGGVYAFEIDNALNITDSAEFSAGDDSDMAPRLTLVASYDPTDTSVVPWRMIPPGQSS